MIGSGVRADSAPALHAPARHRPGWHGPAPVRVAGTGALISGLFALAFAFLRAGQRWLDRPGAARKVEAP